jgi:protein-tyrosine phosphatase
MIDTHAHILPGLDDGPDTIQQAMKFVLEAARQGVKIMFATPHCHDGVYNCQKSDILAVWRIMCHEVDTAGLDVQILPGSEIRVNHDLIAQFDSGQLLTLGDTGKYLLLELPPMFMVPAMVQMVRQLRERNAVPIIAHAERNPMIMSRPEVAGELAFSGARIQITAASLTGDFGREPLDTATILARNDHVFCMGSDIHPGRKYRMDAARKKLTKIAGKSAAIKIAIENPEMILENQEFTTA